MAAIPSSTPPPITTPPTITIDLPKASLPDLPAGNVPRPPYPAPGSESGLPPTIYVIRHGEKGNIGLPKDASKEQKDPKPKHAQKHEDKGETNDKKAKKVIADGLNDPGWLRSTNLPLVFNNEDGENPYDIRLIIAMQPEPTGDQERPFETIWPLFLSLSQKENDYCLLDNTVHEKSVKLAARRIKEFIASGSPGNILLCWEHHNLTNILEAFGFGGAPIYPDSKFDVVWVLEPAALKDASGDPVPYAPRSPSTKPTVPPVVHDEDADLNPDGDDDVKKPKYLWSWDTITWFSEGATDADVQSSEDPKEWRKAAGAPKADTNGNFITYAAVPKHECGPVYAWKASKEKVIAVVASTIADSTNE